MRTEIKEIVLIFKQKKKKRINLGTRENFGAVRDIEPYNGFIKEPEKVRQRSIYFLGYFSPGLPHFVTLQRICQEPHMWMF